MRRIAAALAVIMLAACKPAARQSDSTLPAIDTLRPAPAADTLATRPESTMTRTPTPPTKAGTKSTILGRDSAFPPPRNLPKLDTVKTKRPPQD